jgi:hypothetical protein
MISTIRSSPAKPAFPSTLIFRVFQQYRWKAAGRVTATVHLTTGATTARCRVGTTKCTVTATIVALKLARLNPGFVSRFGGKLFLEDPDRRAGDGRSSLGGGQSHSCGIPAFSNAAEHGRKIRRIEAAGLS